MSVARADIRFERRGQLGVVVLDRPAALNALTWPMVRQLSLQLAEWRDDPEIAAVLVKAAPGRAFCAGGDIRAVAELVRARRHGGGVAVLSRGVPPQLAHPHLSQALSSPCSTASPWAAGSAISVHGDFRIVTENTLFAMPETGIGFFPDVGATWFLPRCPGEVGMYLGLDRGAAERCRLSRGRDRHACRAVRTGWASSRIVLVGSARRPATRTSHAAECLADLSRARGSGTACRSCARRSMRALAARALAEMLERLGGGAKPASAPSSWRVLATKSPLAVQVTFAQLRRGRGLVDRGCIAPRISNGAPVLTGA